jgi:uncharacterized protein (DUF39 family)
MIGDLKQMKPEWLRGTSFIGYGASLAVGIGIPIPILNEEILLAAAVKDEDIMATVVDYSFDYQNKTGKTLGQVSYADLRAGKIIVQGKEVPATPLSSYAKAREIAETLKEWIKSGNFLLTEPVMPLPGVSSGIKIKGLEDRPNHI